MPRKDWSGTVIPIIDFNAIERKIQAVCDRVVSIEIERAYDIARQRVPVRHTFAGGKKRTRPLSISELKSETPMFLRMWTPTERAQLFHGPRGGRVKSGQYPVERLGVETVTHTNRMTRWSNTAPQRRLRLVMEADVKTQGDRVIKSPPAGLGEGHAMRATPGRNEFRPDSEQAFLRPGTGYLAWSYGRDVTHSQEQVLSAARDMTLNYEGRRALRHANIVERAGHVFENLDPRGGVAWSLDEGFTLGGTLRNSIQVVHEPGDPHAQVRAGGGKAYYAQYMEFGTRYVAARPFLRPALAAMERTFQNRLLSALNKIAQKNPITE